MVFAPADAKEKQGAAKKAAKPGEAFAVGDEVEIKEGTIWSAGTVKQRDGDLYLIAKKVHVQEFFWQWAHVNGVRKPGSDKAGPRSAQTVGVAGRGIRGARHEARLLFKDGGQPPDPLEALPTDGPWKRPDRSGTEERVFSPEDPLTAEPDVVAAVKGPLAAAPIEMRGVAAVDSEDPRGKPFPFESMSGPLFSGGPAARAAVGFQRHGNGTRTPHVVEWFDLAKGRSLGFAEFDPEYALYDISPDGKRILLGPATRGFAKGLQVWDLGADGKAKPLVFFEPLAGRESVKHVAAARFIDDRHVFVAGRGVGVEVATFTIPGAVAVWSAKAGVPLMHAPLPVSASRRRVAVVAERHDGVLVIDPLDGKTVARLPRGDANDEAAFSPDGKRLAVGSGPKGVRVFDAATGQLIHDATVPAGASVGGQVHFVGPEHLMLWSFGEGSLFDPAKQFVPWIYELETIRDSRPQSWGGRYWYVTSDGDRSVLTSAVLPHPAAADALRTADVASLMSVTPGMSISLDVSVDVPGADRAKIEASLTKRLTESGFVVGAGHPMRLVARTTPGKTVNVVFTKMGAEVATRQITELKHRMAIERNGQVLWGTEREYSVTGRSGFRMEPDQTLDEAIAAERAESFAIFDRFRIPSYVQKPSEHGLGFGRTKLGPNGIPPGAGSATPAAPAPVAPPVPEGDGLD